MQASVVTMEQLQARLVAWAEAQPDIRAVVVVGSRARDERPADEWSDLDMIVIAGHPGRYLVASDWLADIGWPWFTFTEPTAGDDSERRVLFAGGLDVDLTFTSVAKARRRLHWLRLRRRLPFLVRLLPPEMVRRAEETAGSLSELTRRGARVLLDKDGLAASVLHVSPEAPSPGPPTLTEYRQVTSDFWYHTVWAAKKLRRGELWIAKSCCDSYLKSLLLRLLEWHTCATQGWNYDTWHGGRFLDRWADPRAMQGLRAAFAHYDADDVARALVATMDLARWLGRETAERLGYPYPAVEEEQVTAWVVNCLAGRIPATPEGL